MRASVAALIAALVVGAGFVALGYVTNQGIEIVPEQTERQKLELYRDELEKINENNRRMLADLESQIRDSDAVNLERINQEIDAVRQAITENTGELEGIIGQLAGPQDGQ